MTASSTFARQSGVSMEAASKIFKIRDLETTNAVSIPNFNIIYLKGSCWDAKNKA